MDLNVITAEYLDALLKSSGNPFNKQVYDNLVRVLGSAMDKATAGTVNRFVREAGRIVKVDWGVLTASQQKKIIGKINARVIGLGKSLHGEVSDSLVFHGTRMVRGVKKAVKEKYKFAIGTSMNAVDRKMINRMEKSQAFYFKNEWGERAKRFEKDAQRIITTSTERGLGSEYTSKRLAKRLVTAGRSEGYFRLVANAFMARSRSYSSLSSYNEAGVEEYEIVAVMDGKTSQMCRYLNGKTFKVGDGLAMYEEIERQAENDPESIREISPWMHVIQDERGREMIVMKKGGEIKPVALVTKSAMGQQDKSGKFKPLMSDKKMVDEGIGPPPYHGECRTTTAPLGL